MNPKPMMALAAFLFVSVLALATPGRAQDDAPDQIKLMSGTVLKEVQILRWDDDTILIKYTAGTAPIRYASICDEQRPWFDKHKRGALKKQMASDYIADRQNQRNASAQASADAQAERVQKAENEKAQRIHDAMWNYQLTQGMTKQQVWDSYGHPADSWKTVSGEHTYEHWIFPQRGKNVNGLATDRRLDFTDGVLTGWSDN